MDGQKHMVASNRSASDRGSNKIKRNGKFSGSVAREGLEQEISIKMVFGY